MNHEFGERFIEEKYPDTKDNKRPRPPVTERFEKIASNPRALDRLERLLEDNFVVDIDDEANLLGMAKDLYESEKKIAIERGHGGDIEKMDMSADEILHKYKGAILEKESLQRKTLKSWFTYLKESEDYPMWFKYYVVRSLRGMGHFSRDTKNYSSRTKDTIAQFPELNAEALAFVHKSLKHEFEKENFDPDIGEVELTEDEHADIASRVDKSKLDTALKGRLRNKRRDARNEMTKTHRKEKDAEFANTLSLNEQRKDELTKELLERLKTKDFGKLYSFAQVECAGNLDRDSIEGEWVKYIQGSDYRKLEDDLKGKGTGWCTAEGSAENQLNGGDFYVFYTKNKAGVPTEPRIAIRMEKDSIAEIRGINPRQEIEPELVSVAKEKYKDLPGAQRYEKADSDMKRMTTIYNSCFSVDRGTGKKTFLDPELTAEDLRFLYEIDSKIEGFGYDKDPRIEEVLKTRQNKRSDLAKVFSCKQEQIALTKEEALSGGIVFFDGDLNLKDLTSAEGLELPKNIIGNLNLMGLASGEGLILPEIVGGNLQLTELSTTKGLTFSQRVGGHLDLRCLTTAKELTLPESVGGNLDLESLASADGLTLPKNVGGDLNLENLASADRLTLPESVGKNLRLNHLINADGLTLPKSVGGDLNLENLASADRLTLPESVGGDLELSGLTNVKKLTLPKSVKGIWLENLTTADELTLPENIGGTVNLNNLVAIPKLTFPQNIGGGLNLMSITSAKGLTLPRNVGGYTNLMGLTTADELTLPENINGGLNLDGLTSTKKLTLPKIVNGNIELKNIQREEKDKLRQKYSTLHII